MKQKFILSLIMAVVACIVCQAKTIFPDSETATNEVELGVEGISRLCPTGLWDYWTSLTEKELCDILAELRNEI